MTERGREIIRAHVDCDARADELIAALSAAGLVVVQKEEASVPTEVRTYFMYEDFTFKHIDAPTLNEITEQALALSVQERYGSLCPIIVLSGKKELRRVGKMVHFGKNDLAQLEAWTAAANSDTDIPRLLAGRPAPPGSDRKGVSNQDA